MKQKDKQMNRHLILSLAWFLSAIHLVANPSLTARVSQIDGLPARLLTAGGVAPDLIASAKSIDLVPALKAMGCTIEEGESIIYHAPSRSLLRNLSETNHGIVDDIIETLYRTDNMVRTCRAYIDLLDPLAGEERLRVVNHVGFLPDPLIASMVEKTRLARAAKPSATDTEELRRLDKATLVIVGIALERMKKQLTALESLETEQDGTGQPATRPQSKSEDGDKPHPKSEGRSR